MFISSLTKMIRLTKNAHTEPLSFVSVLCLLSGLAYLGIILLTGFHDRYLLPVCMFAILWIISDAPPAARVSLHPLRLAPSWIPLLFSALFTVGSLHDFMELKRAQAYALHHLVKELRVPPCNIDGGMEFNGYHCYSQEYRPKKGLSWWWINREEYVVSLGPLPGYTVVETYHFKRIIGENGAIHVLRHSADHEKLDLNIPEERK